MRTAGQDRATRVEIYAGWLADDVDGLAHNVSGAMENATAILAEAREKVALALARIDRAIQADHDAHREHA